MADGKLEIITGCMFSGKTTTLLKRAREARAGVLSMDLVRPAIDDRYSQTHAVSHRGDKLEARAIEDPRESLLGPSPIDMLFIDESHMFGPALIEPVRKARAAGTTVVVAGLDRDHLGGYFEPFATLLLECDNVLRLFAPCSVCEGPAVHSQRLREGGERIQVGGEGDYEPRCEAHFEAWSPTVHTLNTTMSARAL